jgi:hypothetical protein
MMTVMRVTRMDARPWGSVARGQAAIYMYMAAALAAACGSDGPGRQDADASASGVLTQGTEGTGETMGGLDTGDLLDVGNGSATGGHGGDCPGGMGGLEGEFEFSYIWIANSPEGTVSKVNTFTGVEEGRYRTGADNPDPSRTSVNQYGDVAVANRNGGIVKIAAREARCVDSNADNTIQTSTGPADVLPWGEDECLLWSQDLPAAGAPGPRPVAWEPVDSQCGTIEPRVWVGFYEGVDQDLGTFRRLDGATGALLDEVQVPLWDYGTNPRPYGGAVNKDGDFWVTGYYGPAIRIDAETLAVDHYPPPPGSGFYGMAVDSQERMWIGGCDGAIYHFDPVAQQYDTIATIEGRARGVQVDLDGIAWFAGNDPCRLIKVDTNTKTMLDDDIPLPGCDMPVGISIDVEGYVWVVDRNAEEAYKVDPQSHQVVTTVTGLVQPYTYSDMTGHGLGLVANPPAG